MEKRNEPIFWMDNRCPRCNHSAPVIYKPDLLKGPIDYKCQSVNNPMRRNNPCYCEWSVVIDLNKKQELLDMLKLAEDHDRYIKNANEIYMILHKKEK